MESVLLLHRAPDHCESNHKKMNECNEFSGERVSGVHFFYFLEHLNVNKVVQNTGWAQDWKETCIMHSLESQTQLLTPMITANQRGKWGRNIGTSSSSTMMPVIVSIEDLLQL